MSDQLLTHRPATDDELDAVTHFVRNADELFYAFPRAHWPLSREQLAAVYAERQAAPWHCSTAAPPASPISTRAWPGSTAPWAT